MRFIFLVALIFFAVVALAGASADDELKSQRTALERIVYQTDTSLLLTERNSISELLTNKALQYFVSGRAMTSSEEAQTRRALLELEAKLPIPSSIYLYDHSSHRVISAAGAYRLSQFPDRAYLMDHYKSYRMGDAAEQWTRPRSLQDGDGAGGSRQVVSLMRVFADAPSKRGAMVINVDTDVLEREVSKFIESATGSVELLYDASDGGIERTSEGKQAVTSTLVRSEYTDWVYRWKNEYLSGYVPISPEHRRWAGVALLPTTVALVLLTRAVRRRPGSGYMEATESGDERAGVGGGLTINPDETCQEALDPKSSVMVIQQLLDCDWAEQVQYKQAALQQIGLPEDERESIAKAPQLAEDEQLQAPEPPELAEDNQMPSHEPAQLAEDELQPAPEPPKLVEDDQTSPSELPEQAQLVAAPSMQEAAPYDEGRRLRGQRLYHDLLTGRVISSEAQYRSRMWELRLSHHYERLGVFLAEIDGQAAFAAQYSAGDRQLYRYAMEQSLQELAGAQGLSARLVWMTPYRLACVLHLCRSGHERRAMVTALADDWQTWVSQYLRMSVTIGIGADSHSIETIAESYRNAQDNLSLKPVFGKGSRIDNTCISCKRSLDSYADLQALEQVVRSLRLMEEDWQVKLALWFQSLREGRVTKQELSMLVHSVMVQMEKEAAVLPTNIQHQWKEAFIPRFAELKEQVETLDELEAGLVKEWSAFAQMLEEERQARLPYHMAMQAKAYVDRHFTEPSLSLTAVSSALQMRPSALSQIFKEELGVKFVDYVIQSRLEHAKRMLTETDEPIQSIAEQCGYPNHISFYRAFKKVLDIPPGEYRSVYRLQ